MVMKGQKNIIRRINGVLVRILAIAMMMSLIGCGTDESAKNKDIKDSGWHYQMGHGYFESKEISLALRELTTSLDMDPDNYKAHFLLGIIYQGRRDYSKALRHYNEVLRIKPDYDIALNNRGSVYLATERWRDAEEDFKELLERPLYPTPELAHNNLGWAYFNLRQYPKSIEHYKMAIFLKPQLCLAYNNLGLAHQKVGARTEAAQNFQSAISKCPNNYAEPHFNLGKMMQEEGHPKASLHFRRCVEIEPQSNLGARCRQYLSLR